MLVVWEWRVHCLTYGFQSRAPRHTDKALSNEKAKWIGFRFLSHSPLWIPSKLRYRKWPLMTARTLLWQTKDLVLNTQTETPDQETYGEQAFYLSFCYAWLASSLPLFSRGSHKSPWLQTQSGPWMGNWESTCQSCCGHQFDGTFVYLARRNQVPKTQTG